MLRTLKGTEGAEGTESAECAEDAGNAGSSLSAEDAGNAEPGSAERLIARPVIRLGIKLDFPPKCDRLYAHKAQGPGGGCSSRADRKIHHICTIT